LRGAAYRFGSVAERVRDDVRGRVTKRQLQWTWRSSPVSAAGVELASLLWEADVDGSATYDGDVLLWSREQAAALRAGEFSKLDIEHLADEIEDVGKSEQRELASRMANLLAHLLKYQHQPDRRGRSWLTTIRTQRKEVLRDLRATPSLQPLLKDGEWRDIVWGHAVTQAAKETGLDVDFGETCPWSFDQVLTTDWLPA
jgi:hypothetical protein